MQDSYKSKYYKYKLKYQNEKRNIITNILKNQKGGAAQSLLEDLQGPITQAIMIDPVIASDGFTYERSSILEVIRRGGNSPMTREVLTANLKPNRRLKSIIEKLVEKRLLEQSVIDEYNQEKREMEERERGAREVRERVGREVRERREREAREAAERREREAAEIEVREREARERREEIENLSNQLRNFLQANRNLTADNIDYILNNVLNEVNHRRLPPNTIELLIVHLRQNPNINELPFANLVRVIDSYMRSEQRVRDNLRIFLQDNGGDISNAEIRRILDRVFMFIRQNGLNLNDIDELINHLAQVIQRNREEFQQNIENNIMNFLEERVEQQQPQEEEQQQQQQQQEEQQPQQNQRDNLRRFLEDNTNLNVDNIDRIIVNVFTYMNDNGLQPNIIPELINFIRNLDNLRNLQFNDLFGDIMVHLRRYIPIRHNREQIINDREIVNNYYEIFNRYLENNIANIPRND